MLRPISVSLAVIVAFTLTAGDVMAEHRKKKRHLQPHDSFYAGPEFVRGVPGLRLLFGDYAMSRAEFEALYGEGSFDDDDAFDEAYYEPRALPEPKPKPVRKAAVRKEAAPATRTAAAKAPSATPQKAAAAPSGGLSCEKAGSIVAGYGFENVKPESCKGKTYAFAAVREGKTFSIKLDSASGELTEVKKLQ